LRVFFDATLPNSDERTAAHETGHVLAAYFLGFPFVYVTIDADERYPGAAGHVAHNITAVHSRITAAEDPWRPGGYWAHTATTVAGRLGECKVFGNYGNGAEEDDGAADLAVRSQVFDPEDYELCHMQVLDLAGEVIFNAALSPAFDAIRAALQEARRLDYAAVVAIIKEHAPAALVAAAERGESL
jgi:hypothetical protein